MGRINFGALYRRWYLDLVSLADGFTLEFSPSASVVEGVENVG